MDLDSQRDVLHAARICTSAQHKVRQRIDEASWFFGSGLAMTLRWFIDQARVTSRFDPKLERALANTEYLFGRLERETKPVSVQLREQIEEIIESDSSMKERCDRIQRAILDAMPEIKRAYSN
jgi:hypothetical protein